MTEEDKQKFLMLKLESKKIIAEYKSEGWITHESMKKLIAMLEKISND